MAKEKINFEDEQVKLCYRHTTSHIMAQAVKKLWPDAKLAILYQCDFHDSRELSAGQRDDFALADFSVCPAGLYRRFDRGFRDGDRLSAER